MESVTENFPLMANFSLGGGWEGFESLDTLGNFEKG